MENRFKEYFEKKGFLVNNDRLNNCPICNHENSCVIKNEKLHCFNGACELSKKVITFEDWTGINNTILATVETKEIYSIVQKYLYNELHNENNKALDALIENKKHTIESIKEFNIGWVSPYTSKELLNLLLDKYTEEEIIASGLFKDKNNLYFIFSPGSYIYPIIHNNEVCNFRRKDLWINNVFSKEDPYTIEKECSGNYFPSIIKSPNFSNKNTKYIYLVEGENDLLAAWEYCKNKNIGLKNHFGVTCTLGGLKSDAIKYLNDKDLEYIAWFDNDEAGISFMKTAYNKLTNLSSFIINDEAKDAFDCIRNNIIPKEISIKNFIIKYLSDDDYLIQEFRLDGEYMVLQNYRTLTIEQKGKIITKNIPLTTYTKTLDLPIDLFFTLTAGTDRLLCLKNNFGQTVGKTNSDFKSVLYKNKYAIDFYDKFPIKISDYVAYIRDNCPNFDTVTRLPKVNRRDKTLYLGEEYIPNLNGSFRKLLNLMTFKDNKSRYIFAAGIISAFFDDNIMKPAIANWAEDQSSGKSAAVNKVIEILTGVTPLLFQNSEKDIEQLNGLEAYANDFISYDNIDFNALKGFGTRNMVTQITDPNIKIHQMYVSHGFIRNKYQYFTTFTSDLSIPHYDIMERFLFSEMETRQNISDKNRLEIENYMQQMLTVEGRRKIISDILYYINNPVIDNVLIKPWNKSTSWSNKIGYILKAIFPEESIIDFSIAKSVAENFDENIKDLRSVLEEAFSKDRENIFIGDDNVAYITIDKMNELLIENFGNNNYILQTPQRRNKFLASYVKRIPEYKIINYGDKCIKRNNIVKKYYTIKKIDIVEMLVPNVLIVEPAVEPHVWTKGKVTVHSPKELQDEFFDFLKAGITVKR